MCSLSRYSCCLCFKSENIKIKKYIYLYFSDLIVFVKKKRTILKLKTLSPSNFTSLLLITHFNPNYHRQPPFQPNQIYQPSWYVFLLPQTQHHFLSSSMTVVDSCTNRIASFTSPLSISTPGAFTCNTTSNPLQNQNQRKLAVPWPLSEWLKPREGVPGIWACRFLEGKTMSYYRFNY